MSLSLVKERLWHFDFSLLFTSRVLKDLADSFASIAFVWLLMGNGGDAVSTSVLFFCTMVPHMLFSSFVSPLLAKGKLQQWMFASDVIRAVAVVVVPICYWLDTLPIWLFFVSALTQSTIGAFYTPASVALLPRIVNPSQLQPANALMQSSSQIVAIIGLAGVGAVIQLFSAAATLLVTSVLLLLSAILILIVRTGKETHIEHAPETEREPYLQQVKNGFDIVLRHKLLFGLTLFAIFLNLGAAPFHALSPVFVSEHLQGDAATLTMLRSSIAIGALVMGIVLAKVKVSRQGALFMYAGIIDGIMLLVLGITDQLWLILACCFVRGAAISAINVPEMVIVQTTVPQNQQAQVFSALLSLSFALLPFAILASGPLAVWFGSEKVIALGGVITLVSGIVISYLTPLVKLRTDTQQEVLIKR
ncbi:MFS transporter [Brevibacillus sp. H7]|uniref:MFS transporter n=1 Tax=Brevibacillus sp. H7 TaxID=3349138 RepID=UPI00382E6643